DTRIFSPVLYQLSYLPRCMYVCEDNVGKSVCQRGAAGVRGGEVCRKVDRKAALERRPVLNRPRAVLSCSQTPQGTARRFGALYTSRTCRERLRFRMEKVIPRPNSSRTHHRYGCHWRGCYN